MSCHADHPRSCGANRISRHAISCYTGSSPLVRGQPTPHENRPANLRIIPARAGPTRGSCSRGRAAPDHPRSCGANPVSLTVPYRVSGSSPLVRGQLHDWRLRGSRRRIIPARAGPTSCSIKDDMLTPDHPRSCGANHWARYAFSRVFGSSPLVRGQLVAGFHFAVQNRIIPARAGPTADLVDVHFWGPDHPRSCGAN